ncbi:hypothetical protein Agabi119p4_9408 [Agaricus bisporus var. burnettii]|uniref:Oxidized purine nucleoside triphosphate hydrolase n=1 Tax=Agaricus bisporus var. burnettii TaxID=192524 RepID=A0A8H7C307_AGABI|nr:hypothetical protein Agabi119p4_9408 [Agaricus bisporus var. burnettii]
MSSQIPPGISQGLDYFASGNDNNEWLPLLPIKHYTVAHILQDDKVLLGYKKRGFGQGMYNGFGGKVEPNETPLQAAVRELEEEAGIKAPLRHIGVLIFIVAGAEKAFHIDIYYAEEFEGTVMETEEMRPEWFSLSPSDGPGELPPIPWDKMWDTDRYWFPLLKDKRPFVGRADFDKNESGAFVSRRWWYGTIQ